jgi:hypothetical protein
VLAGEQTADAVAQRHPDDGERTEHLALRLRADEEGAPTKPIATPSKRAPVTRTSRKKPNAITALKIGTAA